MLHCTATKLRVLVVDDAAQLVDCDVAAAQDQADVLAGEPVALFHGCGDRSRAGALDDLAGCGQEQADGGGDLVIVNEHHLVDQAREQGQRHGKENLRRHSGRKKRL